MPATATASKSTAAKPARKTRTRKAPATPRTRKAAANPQPVAQVAPKVEVVSKPQKSLFDFKDLSSLSGFDFIVLPLILMEVFTVNILQNAGFTVPARVAIK